VSQGVTTIVVGQDGGGINLAAMFARLDTQPVAGVHSEEWHQIATL